MRRCLESARPIVPIRSGGTTTDDIAASSPGALRDDERRYRRSEVGRSLSTTSSYQGTRRRADVGVSLLRGDASRDGTTQTGDVACVDSPAAVIEERRIHRKRTVSAHGGIHLTGPVERRYRRGSHSPGRLVAMRSVAYRVVGSLPGRRRRHISGTRRQTRRRRRVYRRSAGRPIVERRDDVVISRGTFEARPPDDPADVGRPPPRRVVAQGRRVKGRNDANGRRGVRQIVAGGGDRGAPYPPETDRFCPLGATVRWRYLNA